MKQSNYKKPPIAEPKEHILEKFGIKRLDNYYWLKDKTNQKVIDYINQENEYKKELMKDTEELQNTIYNEILSRIKEDDESYPYESNGYYYYHKTEKGKQYKLHCRKKGSIKADEEVIFDVNEMAKNESAFIFGDYNISPNNKLAAYIYNTTGSFAEFDLRIRNLETNKDLDIFIKNVTSFEWSNDSENIIYSTIDKTLRPFEVKVINILSKEEKKIYTEKDEKFHLDVRKDKINKHIIISTSSSTTQEEILLSKDNPYQEPEVFLKRKKDVKYSVVPHKECYYLVFKDKESFNKKIYKLPLTDYKNENNWKEFHAHNKDIKIESVDILSNYLIIEERKNGLVNIRILNLNDNSSNIIEFPEVVYDVYLGANEVYESEVVRYIYNSPKRPETVYHYDINKNESISLKVSEIPSGFNPDDYVVERLFAEAKDGVKVPVSALYKKGLKKDSSNPALLYAYGSYGHSANMGFSRNIFSLIDRGFVFFEAQIRGGSDLGEKWYEDGKLLNKRNTFTDFISCSEHIIKEGYTDSSKLSIMGGSAGGLLMGAVVNMRPDLYNSVIAAVPFVDVVTTMLDDTLPLTTGEYEEWGNPNEEEYFKYMLSYSPYDNIEKKDYPHMLITGGLNDSQVLFHEPTKYIAKLRTNKTDDNIMLLDMDMKSGHGGATGRYDKIKDIALYYAFYLMLLSDNK